MFPALGQATVDADATTGEAAVSGPSPSGASIKELAAKLLGVRNPAAMTAVLAAYQPPAPSKARDREFKSLIEELSGHLGAGRRREAVATALAMLRADAEHVIPRLRRGGILRASKYGYEGSLIANVVKAALKVGHLLNAGPERITYLRSVLALTRVAPNAQALHKEIIRTLQTRENIALKTILVVVNSRFYNRWIPNPLLSSSNLERYTSEDMSDAASLIFSTYAKLFPIHDECCNRIDLKGIIPNATVYERLLVAAVRLTKFRDAETLVDGLPFQAEIAGETVTISSSDPDIERSIRIGYIQSQNQGWIRARGLEGSNPPPSVREFIEKGFEQDVFDSFIELVEKPVKRLRLLLPGAPELFRLFSGDEMFRDEVENLLSLDVDNFGGFDLGQPIAEHVTAIDIFKLQRYFNFISCVYQKKLESIGDEAERYYLTFASTVLIVSHAHLFEQMLLIFGDEAKTRAIIELLAMRPDDAHLDLQYAPLIDLGGHYVIAPHILAASNLVRNVVVAKRLRQSAIGPIDAMMSAVCDALAAAGFKVRRDFELKVGGRKLELDIVAWRDDVLFLFECKNAYHPCSPHEMRNSFDHIKAGRDQLDVRRGMFGQAENQKLLFDRLGWDVSPTAHVQTGIIIANRVFHGATLNGHPVRQAHEFINAVRSGRLVGENEELSFWEGPEFQTSDLVTYLAGDSVAAKQLAALDPYPIEISLGYRRLVFASYILDPEKLTDVMTASYRKL